MTGRRLCGVAVLALAGVVVGDVALRGEEATPDEVLDGPEIRELIAILESEAFRGYRYVDLRAEALKQFGAIVKEGGDELRDAALRRMQGRRGVERRRAELVLAQAAAPPGDRVRELLASGDAEVAAWAWLNLSRRKDAGDAPAWDVVPPRPLAQVDFATARDPLLDVHAAIRDRVEGFEMSGTRTTVRCGDEEPEELRLLRRDADLDGDGVAEQVVAAETAEEYARSVFVAILRRDAMASAWTLAGLRVSEWGHDRVVVTDLDGDGRDEVAVESIVPASPTVHGLCIWSAQSGRFVELEVSYHVPVLSLRRAPGEPALLLTRWPYKDNYGGTAITLVGVLATKFTLWRWNGREFDDAGAAWLAFDD
jgi:hypothetical protein